MDKLKISVNNSNKIILVGNDSSKCVDSIASLVSHDENIKIARTFTTDISFKDMSSTNWRYYMDNDDLFLAFKNNALLCIDTDDDQVSCGVTKEEAYDSIIIPMTYRMFNMASPRSIKGMTICWIDSTSAHRSKKVMIDTSEFMQASKKYPMLYFTDEDSVVTIGSTLYRYIKGDDNEREKILKECN